MSMLCMDMCMHLYTYGCARHPLFINPRRTQKRAMAAVKEGEGQDALPGQRVDIHVCGVPGDAAARILERVGAWQRVRRWQKGVALCLIS